jgi:predicted RNA-binding protein YlxR (DUF448 family)
MLLESLMMLNFCRLPSRAPLTDLMPLMMRLWRQSLKKKQTDKPTPKPHLRSCAACRTQAEKHELLRFVRTGQSGVQYDGSGKLAGRGAYLCISEDCFNKAKKTRALARALRVDIGSDDYERLHEGIAAMLTQGSDKGMVE